MLFGIFKTCALVALLSLLVADQATRGGGRLRSALIELGGFGKRVGLSRPVLRQLRAFVSAHASVQATNRPTPFEENAAWQLLPLSLRALLIAEVHGGALRSVSVFSDVGEPLVGYLSQRLVAECFVDGMAVVSRGQLIRDMFCVSHGGVHAVRPLPPTANEPLAPPVVAGGTLCATAVLVRPARAGCAYIALGYVEVQRLSSQALQETLVDRPQLAATLQAAVKRALDARELDFSWEMAAVGEEGPIVPAAARDPLHDMHVPPNEQQGSLNDQHGTLNDQHSPRGPYDPRGTAATFGATRGAGELVSGVASVESLASLVSFASGSFKMELEAMNELGGRTDSAAVLERITHATLNGGAETSELGGAVHKAAGEDCPP
eukprot:6183158-Pleurochrysis_carterae.AAC.1